MLSPLEFRAPSNFPPSCGYTPNLDWNCSAAIFDLFSGKFLNIYMIWKQVWDLNSKYMCVEKKIANSFLKFPSSFPPHFPFPYVFTRWSELEEKAFKNFGMISLTSQETILQDLHNKVVDVHNTVVGDTYPYIMQET